MLSGESQLAFQRSMSPPFSGSKSKPSNKKAVSSMGQTIYYIKLVGNDRFLIKCRPVLSSERMSQLRLGLYSHHEHQTGPDTKKNLLNISFNVTCILVQLAMLGLSFNCEDGSNIFTQNLLNFSQITWRHVQLTTTRAKDQILLVF